MNHNINNISNVTCGRQYQINTIISHVTHPTEFKDHVYYRLSLRRLHKPLDNEGNDEASIYVDMNDFACIATAIMRMHPEICTSKQLRKKRFEYIKYDPECKKSEAWLLTGTYRVTLERTVNPTVAEDKANIYKLTLWYFTPFNYRDEFVFHLREADVIALGKLCCAALDKNSRGFYSL